MATYDDEKAFLACVLLSPDIIFKSAIFESHFFNPQHRRIFRAMKECADKAIKIDYISVGDVDPEIDKSVLVAMSERVPSGANWAHYQGRVIETYQRKKLEKLGRMMAELSAEKSPGEVIEMAEHELLEIGTNGQTCKVIRMADVMGETLGKIHERAKSHGKLPGISTGLDQLDLLIGGLQPSRYLIVGARPSDGKSALALNMATHIAISENTPVGIISAESENGELASRAISSEGHIIGNRLMTGMLTAADMQGLVNAGEKIKAAPLYLYDAPNIKFSELKSVARQMVAIYKVKCIFVDYIQIVQWEDKKLPFYEQVKNTSLGIKQLARELKIPIVALAQLRRDAEGREPEMADLGDSSQLEKDADALMFIYHKRPKRKDDEVGESDNELSFLLVKKNRDGSKGNVNVTFQREYVKFYPRQG
jgi:replicative DNA helicase